MRRYGFTLIEVLIVIAVMGVVIGATALYLVPHRDTQYLKNAAIQVAAMLRQAQSRSFSQASNTTWGVHLDNTDILNPSYALFSGSAYSSSSGQGVYPLPAGVCYSPASVAQGATKDIIFNQISGAATSTSLTLILSKDCRGASGDIIYWTTTQPLPQTLYNNVATAYNGYMYSLGGGNAAYQNINTVYYAKINSDGTLGSWATTTPLPVGAGIQRPGVVAYNGYLYDLGGGDASYNVISSVYYAKINSDGTLGTWTSTTAMPEAVTHFAALAYNGYLYALGGYYTLSDSFGYTSAVYYAPINANGTVGTWQSTSFIPNEMTYMPATTYINGKIYSLGWGSLGNNVPTIAKMNNDGTLSAWATSTAPSSVIWSQPIEGFNSFLYSLAGTTNGGPINTIAYAKINNDASGTLGTWTQTTLPFPALIRNNPFVSYNGFFYALDGDVAPGGGGAFLTSTVYMTSILRVTNSATITITPQGLINL